MFSPDVLHAINRLDQALDRAETAIDMADKRAKTRRQQRDTLLTEVMTEIDDLFSVLEPERTNSEAATQNIKGQDI